jgi:hypothetical protein
VFVVLIAVLVVLDLVDHLDYREAVIGTLICVWSRQLLLLRFLVGRVKLEIVLKVLFFLLLEG